MAKRRQRYNMGRYSDMQGPVMESIAGPLVGGGIAQAGTLATKLIWPDKGVAKWAGAIGTGLGLAVSGVLAFRPSTRSIGISGIVTSLLVGVPRQIEDLMGAEGSTNGYLGVITPEREMQGAYDDDYTAAMMEQEMMGQVSPDQVQLLSANGAGSLGVITPERDMAGATPEIEMLGANGGFGATFLG